jgi:hypothetical protein
MAIWKLSPLNTGAPDWEMSTYRGDVIVRAKNEEEARLCAMQRFAIAAKVKFGERTRTCPWTQGEFVSCEELVESKYPAIGESTVLEPTRF